MLRTLLRLTLLVVVVAAAAAFFLGYRFADRNEAGAPPNSSGTSGRTVNVGSAREAGADIGEKVAEGANQAQRFASSAAITAKIKSKMALDDTVEASSIDVDTTEGVVTLRGTVESPAQRARAMQLARETDGVTSVIDQLTIR